MTNKWLLFLNQTSKVLINFNNYLLDSLNLIITEKQSINKIAYNLDIIGVKLYLNYTKLYKSILIERNHVLDTLFWWVLPLSYKNLSTNYK